MCPGKIKLSLKRLPVYIKYIKVYNHTFETGHVSVTVRVVVTNLYGHVDSGQPWQVIQLLHGRGKQRTRVDYGQVATANCGSGGPSLVGWVCGLNTNMERTGC